MLVPAVEADRVEDGGKRGAERSVVVARGDTGEVDQAFGTHDGKRFTFIRISNSTTQLMRLIGRRTADDSTSHEAPYQAILS